MSQTRFLLSVFVALLYTSFVLAEAQTNQSVCRNGGVNYLCPTIADEFNRWGITFRSFIPYKEVTQSFLPNSSVSLTAAFETLMVNISAYLNGSNVGKMVIPLVMPQVLQIIEPAGQRYAVRLPLPYDLSPPKPTDPSVLVIAPPPGGRNGTMRAVLWWHDKPTDESIIRHHNTLVSTMKLHNVSIQSFAWQWASWTGPGSDEYYNEVWSVITTPPPKLEATNPEWFLPSAPTWTTLSTA